jgi:hypothetical protein
MRPTFGHSQSECDFECFSFNEVELGIFGDVSYCRAIRCCELLACISMLWLTKFDIVSYQQGNVSSKFIHLVFLSFEFESSMTLCDRVFVCFLFFNLCLSVITHLEISLITPSSFPSNHLRKPCSAQTSKKSGTFPVSSWANAKIHWDKKINVRTKCFSFWLRLMAWAVTMKMCRDSP